MREWVERERLWAPAPRRAAGRHRSARGDIRRAGGRGPARCGAPGPV